MTGQDTEGPRPFADLEARNPAWSAATARVLIVRLSPFRDVDRSATHSFLFREARWASKDTYLDFSFFPTSEDRASLDGLKSPWMRGIASGRGGADFDVLLVSNSFALELLNMVPFLERSGIPALSRERNEAERPFPLVILGGSNALAAQAAGAPVNAIADALFFGEADGIVSEILDAAIPLAGRTRKDRIEAISSVEGIWPCDASRTALKRVSRDYAFPPVPPPLFDSPEAGTVKLEISRGCPSFCTFCFEGRERKPYRERDTASLLSEARRLRAETGAETVELLSFNFNAHSGIVELILGLNRIFDHVNFMSQRTDLLANSGGLADFEISAGKNSFTLGIEGVSARMRRFYRKELPDKDIDTVLISLCGAKTREIKLFYILSGGETADDLAEFSRFCARLGKLKGETPSTRFLFSFGWLVRMPFTPLRYEPLLLERREWDAVEQEIRKTVESGGFEFRTPGHFDEYVISQLIVSLDGGHGYGLLRSAAEENIVYDGTLPKSAVSFVRRWLEKHQDTVAETAAPKARNHEFPLSKVLPSLETEELYGDYLDAAGGIERESCLGEACTGCGACQDAERTAIVSHRVKPPTRKDIETAAALALAKRRAATIYATVAVPVFLSGVHPEAVNAWITRDILRRHPGETGNLLSVRDALFPNEGSRDRFPVSWGISVFAFRAFDTERFIANAGLEEISGWDGTFKELECVMRMPDGDRSVKEFDSFLSARQLTHVKSRTGAGFAYDMSPKSAKKGEIILASLSMEGNSVEIRMKLGPKADLRDLAAPKGTRGTPSLEIKGISRKQADGHRR